MAIPITVPRRGWTMEQGVFVGWLKAEGAPVRAGEVLFALESEKATEDIEAVDDGVLHIPADGPRQGDTVLVGSVIGFVLQPGEKADFKLQIADCRLPDAVAEPLTAISSHQSKISNLQSTIPKIASSPRARRIAERLGVDWRNAKASGKTGRIRERDVLAMSSPVTSTRRVIAERMMNSHRSTAPVTLMTTIDATNLVKFREQSKIGGDLVPSYTDLFIKLAANALEKHPALNARWENDRIVPQAGIHIGIAVDTDAGLVVPVLRDVPRLSLTDLASRSRDLIERAQQRKVSTSELQGGTFTVTSLGSFGIDAFTPIINYPECAILGIGRIRRCPAVVDDQIVIRDQVTLSLTFDHRIVDGAPAARFLQTLRTLIENMDSI